MNTSSLSFLHSAFPTSSSFPPSFSFVVEAHSTTRRQDRTARHTRIRKKVPFNYIAFFLNYSSGCYNSEISPSSSLFNLDVRKFISFGAAGLTESFELVKHVEGTPERPRLSVFRSNKHLSVQVIDDTNMHTLASVSTMQKAVFEEFNYTAGPTVEVAKKVGEIIAKSCLEKGITKVAFDRGGYPYHGRVQALADAAREHGLEF
ncbi:hypothetical protein Ahy_A10g051278 isoform A [Arachis hypogaea]|uniref:Large ribosomal subunit protein uL18c n=1 Tax=Arachis hypogaea TaxID=3818 RepID=A0A445BC93_ARAHY|nr:hypothetical protein Ahy_A10g051278 isoform A [Arachis hypogaea]